MKSQTILLDVCTLRWMEGLLVALESSRIVFGISFHVQQKNLKKVKSLFNITKNFFESKKVMNKLKKELRKQKQKTRNCFRFRPRFFEKGF